MLPKNGSLKTALFSLSLFLQIAQAQNYSEQEQLLARIIMAYPEHIMAITDSAVMWRDGTCMPLFETQNSLIKQSEVIANPTLADQLCQIYIPGAPNKTPAHDPGRARYEPFFRKMYGNSAQEVACKLVTIDWMPAIFGVGTYPLRVTTVNGVDKKLQAISQELEQLVQDRPDYIPFLAHPGGTFCWRYIANTTRLSNHSFGMTIDINARLSHYWQWDLQSAGIPVSEDTPLKYRNTIPREIVAIFEKYGFIWGGKWYHYDTMHFEYRPELFL